MLGNRSLSFKFLSPVKPFSPSSSPILIISFFPHSLYHATITITCFLFWLCEYEHQQKKKKISCYQLGFPYSIKCQCNRNSASNPSEVHVHLFSCLSANTTPALSKARGSDDVVRYNFPQCESFDGFADLGVA